MEVPEGRIYRADVLARGWSAAQMAALTDVEKLPQGIVPEGASNKHYSLAEVEALETSDPAIRKAVARRRDMVPRLSQPVAKADTWTRGTLLTKRGWTVSMVERLLGAPDLVEDDLMGRPVHRWAVERIRQAEATDARLMARRAKLAAEREQEIEDTIESGSAVWRRHGDEWLAQGRDLFVGQRVSVTRRDGHAELYRVEKIVSKDGDLVNARVVKWTPPPPRPSYVEQERQHREQRQREPRAPRIVVAVHRPEVGDLIDLRPPLGRGGRRIEVTRVLRSVEIDEDMPSYEGSHLLGFEGGRGWQIEYKEVER